MTKHCIPGIIYAYESTCEITHADKVCKIHPFYFTLKLHTWCESHKVLDSLRERDGGSHPLPSFILGGRMRAIKIESEDGEGLQGVAANSYNTDNGHVLDATRCNRFGD